MAELSLQVTNLYDQKEELAQNFVKLQQKYGNLKEDVKRAERLLKWHDQCYSKQIIEAEAMKRMEKISKDELEELKKQLGIIE